VPVAVATVPMVSMLSPVAHHFRLQTSCDRGAQLAPRVFVYRFVNLKPFRFVLADDPFPSPLIVRLSRCPHHQFSSRVSHHQQVIGSVPFSFPARTTHLLHYGLESITKRPT